MTPRDTVSAERGTRRGTRVPAAYARLRELIVHGQLAPGTRIIETDIAARLGVSRTPVRGALLRLQQEGYIVASGSGRQVRLSVAPLTGADARELFGIVAQLEALAARWAAEREPDARGAAAAELHAINAEFATETTRQLPDHQRLFDTDQRFHRALVAAGGGPRLLALHEATRPQTERYMRLYISAFAAGLHRSADEHAIMVARIADGDGAGAEHIVKAAWLSAGARLAGVIETSGERGRW